MRCRLALCVIALALTACTDTLEAIAPRAFYGRLVRTDDAELCLTDPSTEEPDGQRCFARGDVTLPEGAEQGDILSVRYDLGEDGEQATATSVAPVPAP